MTIALEVLAQADVVSLGFFDDIWVPSHLLHDGSKLYVWCNRLWFLGQLRSLSHSFITPANTKAVATAM